MDSEASSSGPRILIVDDVPDTVMLLAQYLGHAGYTTLTASNGLDAIEIATQEQPDLILMDVMMPQMDGIEACRQLKTRPQTASIPVILVTAKDPSDARSEGMMAGAVDYITKPVDLEDLNARVNAVFSEDGATIDVKRMLDEVAHTTRTILDSSMLWLLSLDESAECLRSELLVTSSGSLEEANMLLSPVSVDSQPPEFSLHDRGNLFVEALQIRQTGINIPNERLQDSPATYPLYDVANQLSINYLTVVPLISAGKSVGLMILGFYQPHDMESPRAHQTLAAFASQAATALDYARLAKATQSNGDVSLADANTEAQRERAFRQMILDTMSDGLVVIDPTGKITFTNRRLMRMTGYANGYLTGRHVGELFHPEDRDEVVRGLLAEHATTMRFDQRLITKSGYIIPILISRSRTHTGPTNSQVIILSDMTDRMEREQALERHTSQLMALYKAAQAMTSNLSLHEVLQDILNAATSVVEAQGASLFLVSRDNSNELYVVAAVGHRADEFIGLRVPIGEGLAGWVAREAQSQLVTDPANDPRFYNVIDQQTGMSTLSLIAVPLLHGEEVMGVLEVVNKLHDGVFDVGDMRLLESMAGTAAVSIVNARLYDEEQRRVRELATLLGASEAASSTLDFATVLEHIVRRLTTNLDVAESTVFSWQAAKQELVMLAEFSNAYWLSDFGPRRQIVPESALYRTLNSGMPVTVDLGRSKIQRADRLQLQEEAMTSMMVIPIREAATVYGAVVIYSVENRAFGERQVKQASTEVEHWLSQHEGLFDDLDHNALTQLAELLLSMPGAYRVSIHGWTEGSEETILLREIGFVDWISRNGPSLDISSHPTIRSAIESQSVQHITLKSLTPDDDEFQWLANRGAQAALMVPLLLHGDTIGLVALIDINDRVFVGEEINLALGIANVVSNAMENASLYQSLQSRAKALESAYSELQSADQAKDQFMQNVSHELRTPLMHLQGYAELLADNTFGPITPEQKEALDTIVEKGQQIADIVEDMVAVQALQHGQTFEMEPLDLNELLHKAVDSNREKIDASGLAVVLDFPEIVPPVMADANAIRDAFDKLLDNALKFGYSGKQVEVIIRDTDSPVVRIAVRDYGIGIPQDEQERIFQRFYQVDGSATRRYGGTGLGLAVAKSIVEGHGGKIGVRSKEGEGSVFYFSLPKVDLKHKKSTGYLVEQDSQS